MLYKNLTIKTGYVTVERTDFTTGSTQGSVLKRLQAFYIINPATGIKRRVKSLHAAKWRITRACNIVNAGLRYV
jgi:hypothetical protein|tara:strand:- start:151 stop:372 length:222 start_codon:yes stop_codon:yes gene_type:complete